MDRSFQSDQQMDRSFQITSDGGPENCLLSDISGRRQMTNFFNVPGLLVGLNPMSVSECDSVRSPTSPLDFSLLSNSSSTFRFPKPLSEGRHKRWDCDKVGLGSIVDYVDDNDSGVVNLPVKAIPSCSSKTILTDSQIKRKFSNLPSRVDFTESPKSLPKNYPIFSNTKLRPSNLHKGTSDVLFEIGGDPFETDTLEKIQSFSLDSMRLGSENYRLGTHNVDMRTQKSCLEKGGIPGSSDSDLLGLLPTSENKLAFRQMAFPSSDELDRPLSPEEIELSEDYTCVISHGPTPKTTHIFGDCVLECHSNGVNSGNKFETSEAMASEKCRQISAPSSCLTNDFLSYCFYCKKKLEEGKDIFMYRGEKAFCSLECRLEEISIEEEQEKSISQATESGNGDDIFEKR